MAYFQLLKLRSSVFLSFLLEPWFSFYKEIVLPFLTLRLSPLSWFMACFITHLLGYFINTGLENKA
jgi:hypothetical protein